jgi:hypothetical protein
MARTDPYRMMKKIPWYYLSLFHQDAEAKHQPVKAFREKVKNVK